MDLQLAMVLAVVALAAWNLVRIVRGAMHGRPATPCVACRKCAGGQTTVPVDDAVALLDGLATQRPKR